MKKENRKETIYTLILSLICSVQGFAALTVSIEPIETWKKAGGHDIGLYTLGLLILFMLVLTIALLSKRVPVALGCCGLALTVLALVNYYEIIFHGTVTTFQDIWSIPTVLNVVGGYKFQFGSPCYFAAASFLLLILILVYAGSRKVGFKRHFKSAAVTMASFLILCWCSVFAPFAPAGDTQWNWELQYYGNSYVLGMLNSIKACASPIAKPEGYDADKIKDAEGLAGIKENYPDIIMILNESWYDPDHFMDFGLDASVTENYDDLDAYKGYAAVPSPGGRTNSSEYELLTSNSMQIINSNAPFNTMIMNNARSIVDYLEPLGYGTVAAHCYRPSNYRRNTAWTALGFDRTYFIDDFTDKKDYHDRSYLTDSSAFENLVRFCEDLPEEQPHFGYMLTMQNHGGYKMNDSKWDTVHISKKNGLSDDDADQMNEYLSSVKLTDDFIKEMEEWVANSDRDVIVFMVGDHCPSMISSLTDESVSETENDLRKRQTPYLILSNFEIEDLPDNHDIDLCALTPYVVKAAGLPVSAYYKTIIDVSENVHCFTNVITDTKKITGGYIDAYGKARESEENNSIMEYFYMEYNRLSRSGRDDGLFDPE